MRTVEAAEGLALLGRARVGTLAFPVPTAAVPSDGSTTPSPSELTLSSVEAAPGHRRIRLSVGAEAIELDLQVPTPEVSGVTGGWQALTPEIAYVHWPLSDAEALELQAAAPRFVILGNARTLLGDPKQFVRALRGLRGAIGAGPVLWAPRTGRPSRLAALVYLGVDVVDLTEELFDPPTGFPEASLGTIDHAAASAEGLAGSSSGPLEATQAFRRELSLVRAAVRAGRLRELVEARLTSEPMLAELLRYADGELGGLLEERAPILGGPIRTYVLAESLRRPEAVRFRRRILERYRPPGAKRVLVLLPCSKTKPYRNSRSHRRILRALESVSPLALAHFVSVTSPLGVVPRELEDLPPARHYDIPVTGSWNEEERRMVVDAVVHLLSHGKYGSVIAHLDPEEYQFLAGSLRPENTRWTMPDHRSTSVEALGTLREALSASLAGHRLPPGGPLAVVREELQELASVQFGRSAAERLFAPPLRLHGRPWAQRLTDGSGTDLATWQESRGLFHLTVAGGARLLASGALQVELDAGVDLKGDLFTPGVTRADPAIRTGDAVLLVRDGTLSGVGEAALPGRLMTELARGLAVHVRHRSHPPASPTGT